MRKSINSNLLKTYLTQLWLNKTTKILSVSNYYNNYTRTESLHQLLGENNISYHFINYFPKNYLVRTLLAIWWLLLHIKSYDVVLLHFRAYEIFLPVRLVTKIFWKKLIVDHFVSIRDTVCFDKKKVKPDSLIGKICLRYDKLILRLADFVFIDTFAHKEFFIHSLGCPAHKIGHIYVGCNTELFYPRKYAKDPHIFRVFRYGNVLPLQWAKVILEAAKLCESVLRIHFVLVGPLQKTHAELISSYKFTNTTFIDRVPYEQLPLEICASDLCLWGHFSDIDKAKRVIAWKSFQFLECEIPTILGENPANRELFKETKDTYFVPMNDPQSLANLIIKLSHA